MTFRLVTLDLDGTLLPGATAFATILRANGHADVADDLDAGYAQGRLTNEECYQRQWEAVRRLTLADMHRALRKASWLPGILEATEALRAQGLHVAVLTDQPTCVTDFLGRWGITDAIASPSTVKDGKVVHLDARLDKWANLQAWLAARGFRPDEVVHVGNGPNDVPVWQNVGGSVGLFAPPEVARHAQASLAGPRDLRELLPVIERLRAG